MIDIDGSYGEGGGQILRSAIALSAVTLKHIKVRNIRAHRPNPGLAPQHLTAIRAVAQVCNAQVSGLELGSTTIEFHPRKLAGGEYQFDVGTAGSVTLVLQACLPPLLYSSSPGKVSIRGGTDVRWSPPVDYFSHVFLPLLSRMGANVRVETVRRGYYPRGGGLVRMWVEPLKKIKGLSFVRPRIKEVRGIAHSTNLPEHVVSRMREAAIKRLSRYPTEIDEERGHAVCPGAGITLWTSDTVLGASCLGERGLRAEVVGERCATALLEDIVGGATLDRYATDQLLLYMALADESHFFTRTISAHARTNWWLIQQFLEPGAEIRGDKLKEVWIRGSDKILKTER